MEKIVENFIKNFQENSTQLKSALVGKNPFINTFAIGTPENPDAVALSAEQNNKLRKEFETHLKNMHLPFKKVSGQYVNEEKSYVIFNIRLEDAKQLFGPKQYNQQSFFFAKRKSGKEDYYMEIQYWEKEPGDNPFKLIETITYIQNDESSKKDFYTFLHDYKFSIPMKYFESEIITDGNKLIRESLRCNENEAYQKIQESLNKDITGKGCWLKRCRLYKMAKF